MTSHPEPVAGPPALRVTLAGCAATLDFGDPRIAARLEPWIAGFAGTEPPARGAVTMTWRVGTAPPRPREGAPDAPPPIADYYHLVGTIEAGGVVFRSTDGGWMRLASDASRVEVVVPEAMLTGPDWSLRDLFSAALTSLLRAQGRFPVHAAGVTAPDGAAGVLVVGAPMAGKTSLALNFVRRGWRWLSDDKIVLEPAAGGVAMRGLYRPANVDPALARWFPELAAVTRLPRAFPNSEKRATALDVVYGPGVFGAASDAGAAAVAHLLFPRVVDVGATTVTPLAPREALLRLMTQSPIQRDRADAGRQLALLSRLAEGARAFALAAGRDLLESPEALTAAGRTMGLAIGSPTAR
jgi:hypothetical protein